MLKKPSSLLISAFEFVGLIPFPDWSSSCVLISLINVVMVYPVLVDTLKLISFEDKSYPLTLLLKITYGL